MVDCRSNQHKMCGRSKVECFTCWSRSFASTDFKTPSGVLKWKLWSDKNTLSPAEVRKNSNIKFYFNCDKCPHIIKKVVYTNSWCIYCTHQKLCLQKHCKECFNNSFASFDGITPMGSLKKDLWSTKNAMQPYEVFKTTRKKFYFNCDKCPHELYMSLSNVNNSWCLYCATQKICNNVSCKYCFSYSFASSLSKTPSGNLKKKYWSDKNLIKINEVNKNTSKKYIFQCDKCPHEILVHLNKGWCYYCTRKKLCSDLSCKTCLKLSFASSLYKTPSGNLKKDYWDISNKAKARQVFRQSDAKIKFICDKCNHLFTTTVSNNTWCPYCTCKKLCDNNKCILCFNRSFASNNSIISSGKLKVMYWSNLNKKTPRQVFNSSNKKFYFNCICCNHIIYKALHTVKSSWCGYCAGVLRCKNSCEYCHKYSFASYKGLTVNNKLKITCWSSKNKIQPIKVAIGTAQKFYFDCDTCHEQFYISLNNVSTNNQWCPYCTNKTELKLYNMLNMHYKVKQQIKKSWSKSPDSKHFLPFDFKIKGQKVIIELDGIQHFIQVSNWTPPIQIQEHDKYKMKQCLKHGYSMIRISQEIVLNNLDDWQNKVQKAIEVLLTIKTPTIIYIGSIYKKYNYPKVTLDTILEEYYCDECDKLFQFNHNYINHLDKPLHGFKSLPFHYLL